MQYPKFRERLELLIGDETPFGWANKVGISKGAFTRIWNEGTMPKVEHLQKIKSYTGATLDWLIDGEGLPPDYVMGIEQLKLDSTLAFINGDTEKYDRIQEQIKASKAAYIKMEGLPEQESTFLDKFALVPRHDVVVSGGNGALITSEQVVDHFAFNKQWLQKRGLKPTNLVLVEVVGDSMSPDLVSGDTVLVDMSQTDLKTGVAYVIRLGAELLVKYVQRLPGDRLLVSSENRNAYPPFEIELSKLGDEISVIGRVVSSSRNW